MDMKNIKILLAIFIGFGISSFIYEMKQGKKPVKVYREGDSIINVWEHNGKEDKIWKSYQVQKEYVKDSIVKYANYFSEKEILDLKKILDLVITDFQTKN